MSATEWHGVFDGFDPGAYVVPGNACGTPRSLLAELVSDAPRHGLGLVSGLVLDAPPLAAAVEAGELAVRSWHIHGEQRELFRRGLVDYLPVRLHDLGPVVLAKAGAVLIRVSRPDRHGYCSLGPSASYVDAALDSGARVIAEMADDVPLTCGDTAIHVSRIDRLVESRDVMAQYVPRAADATSMRVARHVLEILPIGASLQLGIGAIPEALAVELAAHAQDLRLGLLGLVSEPMIDLVEAIVSTGRGPVQAVELMGTARLMEWAHRNPAIQMRSSRMLHNPAVLAGVPAVVSINSAVAVDLRGQVVAETVRGEVIAGVGGSADFAEGAHLSRGGLRVIVLKATAKGGASTIVARHHRDDLATTAHHGVDVVVTEHGSAWLRGRTLRERGEALVEIAAPEHRAALWESVEAPKR